VSSSTTTRTGTREEWLAAREQLLIREKEHTRLGDELAQLRRELPRVTVEKDYRFDTDEGEKTLAELFDGRSQLLVYHFMFGPSYQAGCPVNSSIADTVDGVLPHLHARDVTFLLVSQAPLEKLQAYKRRMGWRLPWVSTARTDFNFDLGFSHTEEQAREAMAQMTPTGLDFRSATATGLGTETGLPPIVEHNARSTGTSPRAPASARSCTTKVPCTTRTRRRGADWSFSWATTRSSTTHPTAATRARRGSSGSAGTTSTGAGWSDRETPAARPRLLAHAPVAGSSRRTPGKPRRAAAVECRKSHLATIEPGAGKADVIPDSGPRSGT
jgi:predicted dithiol-disulfide oxidoreductase (DUF899 family)